MLANAYAEDVVLCGAVLGPIFILNKPFDKPGLGVTVPFELGWLVAVLPLKFCQCMGV
jgi:hypothetical protein